MRLTPEQVQAIKEETAHVFGAGVSVWLFGSRVDDEARGGDIDLLVHSDHPIEDRQRRSLRLVARLQMRIGDQPIDVVVLDPAVTPGPIHHNALRTGEML